MSGKKKVVENPMSATARKASDIYTKNPLRGATFVTTRVPTASVIDKFPKTAYRRF